MPRSAYVELEGETRWKGSEDLKAHLVPIETVRPNPANEMAHGDFNIRTIQNSLQDFGQQELLKVRADGMLVAGHGRLQAIKEAADKLGWTHVAVSRFTGSAKEAKKLGLVLNRSGQLAEWNIDNLAETISDLQEEEGALERLGFKDDEVSALLEGAEESHWEPEEGDEARMGGMTTHLILPATRAEASEVMKLLQHAQERTNSQTLTAALLVVLRETEDDADPA